MDDIAPHLIADDFISQNEVSEGILYDLMRSPAESDDYDSRDPKDLTLSRLKSLYQQKLYTNVVQYMRNFKTRVILTDDDKYDHRNPNIAWNFGSGHKLDYICTVGNKLGLDAALTGERVNPQFIFELLPRPHKLFSGKYAQVGFDQASSLLYIGSRPNEDIFVCMAPIETLDPHFNNPPPTGFCTGPTTFSPTHARIMIIFLAYCLSLMSDATAVVCLQPYSVAMPPEPMDWHWTSAL